MVHTGKKSFMPPLSTIWKDSVNNKTFLYINLIAFLALLISYFSFFLKEDLNFFPGTNKTNVNFYTDRYDNGKSYFEKMVNSDSAVGIDFVLTEGFPFPYAGFEITIDGKRYFDISEYNNIEVECTAENIKNLYVYLNIKDKNVKDTTHMLSLRSMRTDFNVGKERQNSHITLNSLITQDWWYNKINQPKSDFSRPEFNKVRSINFSSGLNPPLNELCSFRIYNIRFYRDNTLVVVLMGIVQLSVAGLAFLFLYTFRQADKVATEPVNINYKAIEIKDGVKNKSGYNFLDYIHEHYTNAELNLKEISKATGVTKDLYLILFRKNLTVTLKPISIRSEYPRRRGFCWSRISK
jgi:hypothetical protein